MFRHQSLSSNKYAPSNFRKEFAFRLFAMPGAHDSTTPPWGFMDFGYSGGRCGEWPLTRTIRRSSESTKPASAQEGSKRRNSRVSVVSGTITETYPATLPPFLFLLLILACEFRDWCSRLFSQISVARRYANIAASFIAKSFRINTNRSYNIKDI